jgi:hypothetical protein
MRRVNQEVVLLGLHQDNPRLSRMVNRPIYQVNKIMLGRRRRISQTTKDSAISRTSIKSEVREACAWSQTSLLRNVYTAK